MKYRLFVIFTLLSVCFFVVVGQHPATRWRDAVPQRNALIWDMVCIDSNIWLATDSGLIKYNILTNTHFRFTMQNANLPDNELRGLCVDSTKKIWFTTCCSGAGTFKDSICIDTYNSKNTGLSIDRLFFIEATSNGSVWTGKSSLVCLNKNVPPILLSRMWDHFYITDILYEPNGTLWIAHSYGMRKVREKFGCLSQLIGDSLISYNNGCDWAYSLAMRKDQTLWMGTTQGLGCYDGKEFIFYNTQNSEIPTDYVRCIRIDKDENLWLACDSLLVKYNWIVWDIKNPNQNFGRITDIELDGETVWFATQKGLVKYKEERFELIDLSQK